MLKDKLLKLREDIDISQTEIGKRLGMARTTYAGYENGSREPDIETLKKIASFHNVSVEFLIDDDTTDKITSEVEKLAEDILELKDEDQQYILDLIKRLKKDRG